MSLHNVFTSPKPRPLAPFALLLLLVWIVIQLALVAWILTESIRAIVTEGITVWSAAGLLIVAVWVLRQVPTK